MPRVQHVTYQCRCTDDDVDDEEEEDDDEEDNDATLTVTRELFTEVRSDSG